MRSRGSAGRESERQTKTQVRDSAAAAHPYQNLLDLQRRIGNRAVAGILAPVVQREGSDEEEESESEDEFGQVISGHGRFNEEHLATHPTKKRQKLAHFKVPDGMTVVMYAPAGAYLNNDVANRIERGDPPAKSELVLQHTDAQKFKPLPKGYPYTFTAGKEVIDYTVMPPDRLTVEGSPITVDKPTPLRTLVARAVAAGHDTVHYACCSSGFSERSSFKNLFPERGYYVRFTPETTKRGKKRKRADTD